LIVVGLVLASAGTGRAAADSLSLSTSPSQPSDTVPPQIVASGDTSNPAVLHVEYRQADTGGCASDPTLDTGTAVSPDGTSLGVGQFGPVVGDPQTLAIGGYLLCGWITDPSDPTVVFASASATFTVTASDSVALLPVTDAVEGRPFDVDATGIAYDPDAIIDATYKPEGGACAASPDLDTGDRRQRQRQPTRPRSVFRPGAVPAGPRRRPLSRLRLAGRSAGSDASAWRVVGDDQRPSASSVDAAPGARSNRRRTVVRGQADRERGLGRAAERDRRPQAQDEGRRMRRQSGRRAAAAAQELNEQLTGTQQPTGVVSSTNSSVSVHGYGAYLVCAWLLNGWTTAANPPTVAGPISVTVTAVRPETFRGRTSQRLPINITLAPVEHLVLEIGYKDRLRCAGPTTFTNGTRWNGLWSNDFGTSGFGTVRVRGSGSFGVNLNGNHNHTFKLHGQMRRKRITGTFSERGKSSAFTSNPAQSLPCGTGTVRYTVRTR
jgi:hypothetical protein